MSVCAPNRAGRLSKRNHVRDCWSSDQHDVLPHDAEGGCLRIAPPCHRALLLQFQNPANGRWEVTNLNTGHFGENGIYEGVKKIRCVFTSTSHRVAYMYRFNGNITLGAASWTISKTWSIKKAWRTAD